jgi:hypothetical protein
MPIVTIRSFPLGFVAAGAVEADADPLLLDGGVFEPASAVGVLELAGDFAFASSPAAPPFAAFAFAFAVAFAFAFAVAFAVAVAVAVVVAGAVGSAGVPQARTRAVAETIPSRVIAARLTRRLRHVRGDRRETIPPAVTQPTGFAIGV